MEANQNLRQYPKKRSFRELFLRLVPDLELEPMESCPAPLSFQSKVESIMDSLAVRQAEICWWVEINTSIPLCTYYFGPFDSQSEAQDSRSGYVEDLCLEGARDIIALVKQCQPNLLTIDRGYYQDLD
jgi:hypothetical protein